MGIGRAEFRTEVAFRSAVTGRCVKLTPNASDAAASRDDRQWVASVSDVRVDRNSPVHVRGYGRSTGRVRVHVFA